MRLQLLFPVRFVFGKLFSTRTKSTHYYLSSSETVLKSKSSLYRFPMWMNRCARVCVVKAFALALNKEVSVLYLILKSELRVPFIPLPDSIFRVFELKASFICQIFIGLYGRLHSYIPNKERFGSVATLCDYSRLSHSSSKVCLSMSFVSIFIFFFIVVFLVFLVSFSRRL